MTEAFTNVNNNASPGTDRLPGKFYKAFWPIIGQDYFSVFTDSINEGKLPLSCRRAVLTLLPKAGNNNLIKNWRPVSLLCADYKILTKTLSRRLRSVLSEIIHIDQSYSVPGRSISDNINLLRDTVTYANDYNVPLAILSLDQQKAFDRVHHEYLEHALAAFGFGPTFIKYIMTLYTGTESLIKVNQTLTTPLEFKRGIRQGCSLSGQLYTLCIEPLLHKIRTKSGMQGFQFPDSDGEKSYLSAYADDVDFFITNNSDFEKLHKWLEIYEKASNAKINMVKSEGLWAGRWKNRQDRPLGMKYNNVGLKMLGTYIGNTVAYAENNWKDTLEKIDTRLNHWNQFAKALSFRGRVLVINQLCASKLWHRLITMAPSTGLLNQLQTKFNDFFWQGRHWVARDVLYQPVVNGGQGLVHLESRLTAFRLQYVQRYLYSCLEHPSFHFTSFYLKQLGNLKYSKQLFATNFVNLTVPPFYPKFYQQLINACSTVRFGRNLKPQFIHEYFNEPIYYNDFILHPVTKEPFSSDHFSEVGLTTIGDLIDQVQRRWKYAEELASVVPIVSHRILKNKLDTIHRGIVQSLNNLPHLDYFHEETETPPPTDTVKYNYTLHCKDDVHDNNLSLCLYKFEKHVIYEFLISSMSVARQDLDTVWRDILSVPSEITPNFKDVYKSPIYKKEGDFQWRLLKGAISTGTFMQSAGYTDSDLPECPFCQYVPDDLSHMFLECPRLAELFNVVTVLVEKITGVDTIPLLWFIFGPPYKKGVSGTRQLINYIFITAKLVIHTSHYNCLTGTSRTDVLQLFRSRIQKRLLIEYQYAKLVNKLDFFDLFWCNQKALCCINEDKLEYVI